MQACNKGTGSFKVSITFAAAAVKKYFLQALLEGLKTAINEEEVETIHSNGY